jgi:hypothetical protein
MAGNTATFEFAGDASKLQAAAKRATAATDDVGKAAKAAGDGMGQAAKGAGDFTTRAGKLGAAVDGASTAIGDAAGTLQALADAQDFARAKSARLERAQNDVRQAQEDMNQAMIDGKQAVVDLGQVEIDKEQADLDAAVALKDYNEAVKEHGANSLEARQASLDLKQANQDLAQAYVDEEQYRADANQALIDGKDAQLNMNDAMREANPPQLQEWADQMNMVAPLLQGLVGVVALVTAAQWAWNAAQYASPTTWIIVAIVALIAVIVLIATKTDWFQRAWRNSWNWIKSAAKNTWDWLKQVPGWIGTAFGKVANFITAPFRWAFNYIASAWNNTIGRLSWTVPGWVPGIGGNTISVPNIPKFHSGGVVPGAPGSEMLAVLQAGETVTPAGRSSGGGGGWVPVRFEQAALEALLIETIQRGMGRRGGRAVALGVRVLR